MDFPIAASISQRTCPITAMKSIATANTIRPTRSDTGIDSIRLEVSDAGLVEVRGWPGFWLSRLLLYHHLRHTDLLLIQRKLLPHWQLGLIRRSAWTHRLRRRCRASLKLLRRDEELREHFRCGS